MGKWKQWLLLIMAFVYGAGCFTQQLESAHTSLLNEKQSILQNSYNLADHLSRFAPEVSNQVLDTLLLNNPSESDYLLLKSMLLKASNYASLNQPDLSENELKKALRFAEINSDLGAQGSILIELGKLHLDSLHQKSFLYLQAARKIATEAHDTILIINTNHALSHAYAKRKNLTESKATLDSALFISQSTGNTLLIAKSLLALGKTELMQDNLNEGQRLLLLSDSILSDTMPTTLKIEILHQLASSFAQSGDYLTANEYLLRADSLQQKIQRADYLLTDLYLTGIQSVPSSGSDFSLKSLIVVGIILLIGMVAIGWLALRLRKNNTILRSKTYNIIQKMNELALPETNFEIAVEQEKKKALEKQSNDLKLISETLPKLSESLELSSQADYLKDVFLAKLSHEVRSPLTTILGFSSLLETELAIMDKPELYEYASSITQSGQSLIDLLDNIFDLSLINSNNLQLSITKFSLSTAINDVVSKFEKDSVQKGIRVITSTEQNIQIVSDLGLLKRVLNMIVDNAVRFTEKGFVKISSTTNTTDNTISISIKDTGVGIDKVYLKDIFEPYRKEKLGYSTRYQGTGLSLPLASKMIGLLQGIIKMDSEIGVGTTITISVPTEVIF
jgi:signal transduction histidine kinase